MSGRQVRMYKKDQSPNYSLTCTLLTLEPVYLPPTRHSSVYMYYCIYWMVVYCTVYTHISIDNWEPWPILFFSCLLVFCIYLFIFFSVPFSSYSYSAYLIFLCSWLLCLFSFALTLCLCMCVPAWPQESRVFAGWLKSSFPSFAISLRSSYLSLQCDRRLPFFCLLLSVFFFSFFFFPLFFSFSFCYSIFINKTESQSERDASQRPKERRVAKIAHLLLMKQSLQPKIFSLFVTSNR